MDANEKWKPIKDIEGYFISSFGRIGSMKPIRNYGKAPDVMRILKCSKDKNGYNRTTLYADGEKIYVRVCVLVAEAWHGTRPQGMIVRHLDGSKTNDNPSNLAWGTPKENSQDAIRHGTLRTGNNVNTSRLIAD